MILMPCHNPFMIAERVATLDVLSNGRCEFGAGRGTAAYVVEGLGFNADAEYGRGIGREALEAVVQMLEREHFPGYKSATSIFRRGRGSPPDSAPAPASVVCRVNLETSSARPPRCRRVGVTAIRMPRSSPREAYRAESRTPTLRTSWVVCQQPRRCLRDRLRAR